ncbi:MAG TPA: hypothetical protein PKO06_24160 [Candidatus Ozemobacteraceae bacterium]|nr:hypothetical protein [Candidatus Ozemobacteraceae bacterium]
MDSSGAVYAKFPAGGVEALEQAVSEARKASRHTSPIKVLGGDPIRHAYAVVDRWGRSDNMPIWAEGPDLTTAFELVELSRLVGDVVAFYTIDDGLSMGIYGAWKDGRLVRNLQWMDDQWQVVEGDPQPWEKPLFSSESREACLECARDNGWDESEVQKMFQAGVLQPGFRFPIAHGLVRHINAACPGPLYGFEPWPARRTLLEDLGLVKKRPR